ILVLVRDLMFSSRILAEAKAVGRAAKVVRDLTQLIDEPGERLILDLNQSGTLEAAIAWKQKQGGATIGFVAHTDTEIGCRARESGIDQVVTRGQFVSMLPQLLRGAD